MSDDNTRGANCPVCGSHMPDGLQHKSADTAMPAVGPDMIAEKYRGYSAPNVIERWQEYLRTARVFVLGHDGASIEINLETGRPF
ncbi:hypothetical protein [Aureimonas pseudogalii]|uniref:Uncharacterized protein n=1 Tax=Aureimonas pseudogalii TaxID=1744844 RepID=A0A7W6EDA9_9HYPH|nr:hypothetical protein [Aureimonas pseudogalii]MBB3997182.1 hypothetical protein [Aureimonas pseudogalii]